MANPEDKLSREKAQVVNFHYLFISESVQVYQRKPGETVRYCTKGKLYFMHLKI